MTHGTLFTRLVQSSTQPDTNTVSLALPPIPATAPVMQPPLHLPGVSSAQSSPGFFRWSIMQPPPPNSQLSMRSSMSQSRRRLSKRFRFLHLPPQIRRSDVFCSFRVLRYVFFSPLDHAQPVESTREVFGMSPSI